MARLLFAREMGGNLGHLARDLPLAIICKQRGHDVLFAVNHLEGCHEAAQRFGVPFVRVAPIPFRRRIVEARRAINFADLLLRNGFADEDHLKLALSAWMDLFASYRPDVIVNDFAPRALLAARIANVPVLLLSNGFETPPAERMLPSFAPWDKISPDILLNTEMKLVDVVNGVLSFAGISGVTKVSELYSRMPLVMPYHTEFDHFGPRAGARYVGLASILPNVQQVDWRNTGRTRVIVYLRAMVKGVDIILEALQQGGYDAICFVPDFPLDWADRFKSLRLVSKPVDLPRLLLDAHLMIAHGSGSFADAICSGVPVLMVPSVVEQLIISMKLGHQGFGKVLNTRESADQCDAVIESIMRESRFRYACECLMKKYRDFTFESSVEAQMDTLLTLV